MAQALRQKVLRKLGVVRRLVRRRIHGLAPAGVVVGGVVGGVVLGGIRRRELNLLRLGSLSQE
ncbi:hypothetical protein ACWDWO_10660 [Actinopolymorpha singaporensis]|uniref:hypothetical protein n=1 Tax=Actinopolymorpha singaporensis TaxID=117157 RepID=UPI0012FD0F75|nr:hypothetical protein [Actinopolymorpha singaporensis]